MRMKLSNKIRPEFRRLLKECGSLNEAARMLATTPKNVSMMKFRGYLSESCAGYVDGLTFGRYKARLLVKK